MLANLFVALYMKNKGKTMNLETQLNKDAATDFNNGVEKLLENIGNSFANWTQNEERTQNFRDGLRINKGRKFTKVIEKNRVWGFVANADGVLKGIPYFKGDVFKAAGWRAPAKHVRGSIFSNETNWFTWTGPIYL